MSVGDNYRSGNVLQGAPEGLISQTVTLTADGQYVDPNALGVSMINLESNNTTASNRTFTLANGSMDGQGLLMIFTSAASTTAELADSGNVSLSSAWTPVVNDSLGLTWNARLGKWIETSRYVATGSDISGPGSSTDNAVVRWDGATGAVVQNSVVTIGDTGNVAGVANLNVTGTTTLAAALSGIAFLTSGVVSAVSALASLTSVAIGGALTNASTGLEVNSTTRALLVSRMTTAEKNALTAVNGMIVYDSTLNKFQGYENGAWTSFI